MLVKLGMYPRIRLPYGESAAEYLCSGGTNSASVRFFLGGVLCLVRVECFCPFYLAARGAKYT